LPQNAVMDVIHLREIDHDLAEVGPDGVADPFDEFAAVCARQLAGRIEDGHVFDVKCHRPKSASFSPIDERSRSACSKTFCHFSFAQISKRLVMPTMTTSDSSDAYFRRV